MLFPCVSVFTFRDELLFFLDANFGVLLYVFHYRGILCVTYHQIFLLVSDNAHVPLNV